jgi:hypothetical protein
MFKVSMRVITVLLGIGLASTWQPVSAYCFDVHTDGPLQCNCLDRPLPSMMCTSATISVSASAGRSIGIGAGGFSAAASSGSTQQVSTGTTQCYSPTIPPGKCVYIEYESECCVTWILVEGVFIDHFESTVSCTYVGSTVQQMDKPGGC